MQPVLLNASENLPRTDYPRPQWMRREWLSLNGEWEFAYDAGLSGKARGMAEQGEYPLKINVPFCPESRLSGLGNIDFIPAVWYRRTMSIKKAHGHARAAAFWRGGL